MNDVVVHFSATHPWDEDLDIYLISPQGTVVELSTDNGGFGDNYTNTEFDDDAATSIVNGSAPFTGTYRPESPLSAVDGEAAGGTWTLKAIDDEYLLSGSITDFSIDLQTVDYVCHPIYTSYFPLVSR